MDGTNEELPADPAAAREAEAVCDTAGMLAVLSLSCQIPEFWRQQPKLWFYKFEAIAALQGMNDEQRWQAVITKLQLVDLQRVRDLVITPPPERKYDALKARLISENADYEIRQIKKLLGEIQLGDQRPSQLLHRMRNLAGDELSEDGLKFLWASHLPTPVRVAFAFSYKQSLDDLAVVADIHHTQEQELAPVANASQPQMQILQSAISELASQLARLSMDIASLYAHTDNVARGHQPTRWRPKMPTTIKM